MTKHISRRFPLRRMALSVILCGLLAVWLCWENTSLQTTWSEAKLQRLPAGFDGYRIAVLSDLHGRSFGRENEALFQAVRAVQPDGIAVVGDLLDQGRGLDWAYVQTTAAGLAAIAPVYYVTGNHEWALGSVPQLKTALAAAGWTVLSNTYTALTAGDDTIFLAGIDDPNGYADQKTPEALAAELYAREGHPFWILLAHRNDRFAGEYSLLGADLTISGHGHGGMIRLPFTDGLIGTQGNWFPSYTSGFYQANGAAVFVSRGLGSSSWSFRLFNRPEIAVVTLRAGGESN